MVLAAGLGTRMRPITDTCPKPLVKVAGTALLDHALDRLADAGIARAVVNVHYLADQVEAHLKSRKVPKIAISDERGMLLETGGGIKKALPLLGKNPFLVMNSDSFWVEGRPPTLPRMMASFDAKKMDMFLLVAASTASTGYDGRGDFVLLPDGRLERRKEKEVAPFVYTGVAIIDPAIFKTTPDGAFSLNLLFDRAIESGRLFGQRLDGLWMHVGTPDAIGEAEAAIGASIL
ncbi:MAG: nucleotidyltransferase family protein [Rhodobiaceae bacterium]|nr:nucleotidyltransferase family protein [Rhodobiaceae bacterium]MCC0055265.1 nucleotidyltransferase family protein [Rhodobiaceae bacterium]